MEACSTFEAIELMSHYMDISLYRMVFMSRRESRKSKSLNCGLRVLLNVDIYRGLQLYLRSAPILFATPLVAHYAERYSHSVVSQTPLRTSDFRHAGPQDYRLLASGRRLLSLHKVIDLYLVRFIEVRHHVLCTVFGDSPTPTTSNSARRYC